MGTLWLCGPFQPNSHLSQIHVTVVIFYVLFGSAAGDDEHAFVDEKDGFNMMASILFAHCRTQARWMWPMCRLNAHYFLFLQPQIPSKSASSQYKMRLRSGTEMTNVQMDER